MAPNPVVIPRRQKSQKSNSQSSRSYGVREARAFLFLPLILTLLAIFTTARRSTSKTWLYSGAALESLLLIYSSLEGGVLRHEVYLWISLVALNLLFAVSSTSWLLRYVYMVVCYVAILLTCLLQFPATSYILRKGLRRLLHNAHFWKDNIGLFDLPALEIDTEASGIFVVRGLTLSLSSLSIEARGIELGLRLNDDVELALSLDLVTVRLFRHIDVSDIYGNLKVNESMMSFNNPEDSTNNDQHKSSSDRSGLQNATGQAVSKQSQSTGNEHESSEHCNGDNQTSKEYLDTTAVPTNDSDAEERYNKLLTQIERSSQIRVARNHVEQAPASDQPNNEREMRQAVCVKLQDVPSISHTPSHAVKVSVLQTIFPRIRRFLHRLPLLLRLMLNVLSYFHPINISSISIAGPGERLKALLEEYALGDQEAHEADMKQLEQEMSSWLGSASFCVEVADLSGLGHVPLSAEGDITTYLRSADVTIYRTPNDSNVVRQVTHIGGTDMTCMIPAFLLPHHEHCLPQAPKGQNEKQHNPSGANPNGETSASSDTNKDEAEITISVHASLPTHFDQSILDFAAALMKATKLIDLENLFEREAAASGGEAESSESWEEDKTDPNANNTNNTSSNNNNNNNNNPTQDSSEATTSSRTKLAQRARQSVKDTVKKGLMSNAVGDKVNDRWMKRTVGRIAARLEQAAGDFGYTSSLPLPLGPYRPGDEVPSKLLP